MAESTESSGTAGGNTNNHPTQNFSSPIFLPQNHSISIKLTEGNSLIWQQQILATVRGYGLESYLTGEREAPPQMRMIQGSTQTETNPDFLTWHRQDQLLSAWIQSSLSESAMISVVGLGTSIEIWSALEMSFASQSKAKIMQYKLQLQTMKKDSMCMREYLNKVKMCCDLLGSAGCKIADEDQILHILGGLGSEYDPIMVTVTSKANVWSVQDVGALLLTFESRQESSKQLSITSEGSELSVNIAHSGFQRRDSQSLSNRGNFGGGNRGGNHGFRGGRGGRGGRFSGNKPTCQVCQKPGHTADRCWHRFEQHFQPQAAPRARQPQHQQSYQQQQPFHPAPSANVAQTRAGPSFHSNSSPSPRFPSECSYERSNVTSWYPDSGATNHVSNDLSNLNSFSEYNGGQCIQLGNGKGIHISHIGQSSYKSHASHSSRTRFLNNLLHAPQITKNLMSVSQFAKDNKVFFEFHLFLSCEGPINQGNPSQGNS